jgi:hypothetical protein
MRRRRRRWRRRGRRRGWRGRCGSGGRGGSRRGRRSGCRRRGLRARRQKRERIEVAVLVARDANSEVDVGRRVLGLAAWPHYRHRIALADRVSASYPDFAEVRQRDGVPARRGNRKGEPVSRDGAGEGDRAARRRSHDPCRVGGDVDSAVLTARVGVGPEREGAEYRPVDRPRPGEGSRRDGQSEGGHRRH